MNKCKKQALKNAYAFCTARSSSHFVNLQYLVLSLKCATNVNLNFVFLKRFRKVSPEQQQQEEEEQQQQLSNF